MTLTRSNGQSSLLRIGRWSRHFLGTNCFGNPPYDKKFPEGVDMKASGKSSFLRELKNMPVIITCSPADIRS